MSKTIVAELVAVFKGDTKDLEKATESATKSVNGFAKATALAAVAAAGAIATLTVKQIELVGRNK